MSSRCDLSRGIAQVRRRELPKYQPIMALYGAPYSPTRCTKYDYSGKDHVQVLLCLPNEVTHWLILDFIVSDRKGQNAMNLTIPSSSSTSSTSQVLGHCAHASTPWPSPAYVVGTANAIKDDTAIAFASGFYFGLAQGLTVEKAYTTGRMQAVIKDIKAKDLIVLYKNGERQKL